MDLYSIFTDSRTFGPFQTFNTEIIFLTVLRSIDQPRWSLIFLFKGIKSNWLLEKGFAIIFRHFYQVFLSSSLHINVNLLEKHPLSP